jgi:hypothetical protein
MFHVKHRCMIAVPANAGPERAFSGEVVTGRAKKTRQIKT